MWTFKQDTQDIYGKYMWSTSVPLRSLKCIMAQTFLLNFSCTWFYFFLSIYLILLTHILTKLFPEWNWTGSFTILSVVQIIYILLFNLFSLQFIFSKKSKIYVSSLFFSICTALAIGPAMFIIMLGSPEKVTLMILYNFHSCSVLISVST